MKIGNSKSNSPSFFGRLLRSFFTVLILTAFVFGTAYFIKYLFGMNEEKVFVLSGKVLDRAGIDSDKFLNVAGTMSDRAKKLEKDLEDKPDNAKSNDDSGEGVDIDRPLERKVVLKVALVADSHNNNVNLQKALQMSVENSVNFAIHLGDTTDLGTVEDLNLAKEVLDASGIEYYVMPGDHDLWQTVGPQNFVSVFGEPNQIVEKNGIKILILDNSANYTEISSADMKWLSSEVKNADFLLLSQPIYHPTNSRVMGYVNEEEVVGLKAQANEILEIVRDSGVKAIISADHHFSSVNIDPANSQLKHVVVGSLADERNLQSARFSYLYVYDDGDFEVKDVVIE